MAVSLNTYLNNKIKSKGSSLAKEKAKAGKYKSISAAKKAGALYYTDKNGKVMAAVYAEDLKKSPVPPKKSLRPKKRPDSGGSVPAATAKETAELKKRNAEIKLAERARKDTGPNAARKQPMSKKKVAPITFAMWDAMSRAERKSKGLPVSDIGGQLGFNRFKTGITGKEYDSKGRVVGVDPSKKKDTRSPDPLRLAGRGGIR
tara:strand:+ start:39 stop:647 length:609 start_codon:yes stop_codon:yes gene_type:complete